MAEKLSKRAAYIAKMKERHPEVDFDDEDARYGAYDEELESLEKHKNSNKKFADAFSKDPKFAKFTKGVMEGGSPTEQFVRIYGEDALNAYDDDEALEKMSQAHQDYLNEVADGKKLEEEQKKNLDISQGVIQKFAEAHKMDEQTIDAFLEGVYQMYEDGLKGIVKQEVLEMVFKAKNYDADLSKAAKAGEVKGKNEKIKAIEKQKIGDGSPRMESSNSSKAKAEQNNSNQSYYQKYS